MQLSTLLRLLQDSMTQDCERCQKIVLKADNQRVLIGKTGAIYHIDVATVARGVRFVQSTSLEGLVRAVSCKFTKDVEVWHQGIHHTFETFLLHVKQVDFKT